MSANQGMDALDLVTRGLVSDLQTPKAARFWGDLIACACIGWGFLGLAVAAAPFSGVMVTASVAAGLFLYRGLCFTHELAHLKRKAIPGFETAWNMLFGVPLLLPSFTYLGVHQSHHSLSTYGTLADPEYLPFARSRRLMLMFGLESTLLLPLLIVVRFLVLAPLGLVVPRFHRWLETHASSFAMNPAYRREVAPEMVAKMKRWEGAMLGAWATACALTWWRLLPSRLFIVWCAVFVFISFLNTVRVLAAHEYETDGTPRTRQGQLADSIDTPGGPWTELWAPVGLRYHALHHYFPGIPYHNLRFAYQRLVRALPADSPYRQSTSPSLRHSLTALYVKAKRAGAMIAGSAFRSPGA